MADENPQPASPDQQILPQDAQVPPLGQPPALPPLPKLTKEQEQILTAVGAREYLPGT